MRGNKFGAKRTMLAGRSFDSRAEALRGQQLLLLERAGEISGLRFQYTFRLTEAEITYRADFIYIEKGRLIAEDVKGVMTDRFRLVCKLWQVYGPCALRITKRKGERFLLAREIPAGKLGVALVEQVAMEAKQSKARRSTKAARSTKLDAPSLARAEQP